MPKKINIKGPVVDNDTGWFYKWIGWEHTSPDMVAEGLKEAGGEEVILEINSPGGLVTAGYEIYAGLMEYEGKITANVICACSAATLPACAADEALISDAGIYMIHNAQSDASGDKRNMHRKSDVLGEIDNGIINVYVRKTGLSREELQNLMDNSTYMSPQTAIQYGFIDGYMFGDPNKKETNETDAVNLISTIAAADIPIIAPEKAKEIKAAVLGMEPGKNVLEEQNNGDEAVSEYKEKERGDVKMTLSEFLAENPDAQAEYNGAVENARMEGGKKEKERLQSLDAISATVSKEALNEAKYGENPVDGPTLAYQAMVNGDKTAAAYMEKAKADAEASNVNDVGVGNANDGMEEADDADEMVAYINKTNGGKQG